MISARRRILNETIVTTQNGPTAGHDTQLQQAIRMLQMSTVELQQEIQTALDENPLLS